MHDEHALADEPCGDERLIRYLVMKLEDELHEFIEQARELRASRQAPGPQFLALERCLHRRRLDIHFALGRHATPGRKKPRS